MSKTKWIVYAIRNKHTGFFLPMRWKSSRGFSYDEPDPLNNFPRIFKTKRAAQNALNAWCKGKWTIVWEDKNANIPFPVEPDYEMSLPFPEPVEGRNKEDMEIVIIYAFCLDIPVSGEHDGFPRFSVRL